MSLRDPNILTTYILTTYEKWWGRRLVKQYALQHPALNANGANRK
jgi:hypothetical protein